MMLLLGVYTVVMEAVADLNLLVLAPAALGVTVGLISGIKVIKRMLRFHPQALYLMILGLVAGSVFAIYPGFSPDAEGFLSLAGLAVFALLAYVLSSRK